MAKASRRSTSSRRCGGRGPETTVPGRGTEMSEGGMLLYAGILLNPGDMLELEFNTPSHSRMTAVVATERFTASDWNLWLQSPLDSDSNLVSFPL